MHAADRVDEHRRREDALFEEVADAFGVGVEQPHGVGRLDVLRQHEHGDVGVIVADPLGGDETFVGVGRRHLDVDDGDVRRRATDLVEELVGVLGLTDDVDAGVAEEVDDAFAGEQRVVGDYDAHGISAVDRVGVDGQPAAEGTDAIGQVDDRGDGSGSSVRTSTTGGRRPRRCARPRTSPSVGSRVSIVVATTT